MKKFLFLFLVCMVLFSSFCGVSAKNDKYVIGVSLISFYNEYMQVLKAGLEINAPKLGNVKLIMNDAQANAERQLQQIENFIAQRVNAIIMSPCQYEACSTAINRAKEAGIPIINLSTDTKAEPDAFVGSKHESATRIAMEYIAKQLKGNKKINIVMMRGVAGQSAEVYRSKGAYDFIKSNPKCKLLAEQIANWDRNEGLELMENWLQAYGKKIDAVYAQNDEMGLGALEAIRNSGLAGKIVVVSVDGIYDARKAVKEGRLNATVLQNGLAQGKESLNTALKILEKKPYQKFRYIPFELITSKNVKKYDYIDDFLGK